MRLLALMIVILPLFVMGCQTNKSDLTTVARVDLQRYLGKWYQYAYYPNSFQPKDCGLTTAEYSLDSKGKIVVLNTCYEDSDGKIVKKDARAKAWSVNSENTKLKVRFFWPFTGNYWIIDLEEENYSYAVVGEPSLKYLWVLTREPSLDSTIYEGIKNRLVEKGYDPEKLVLTGRI